MKTILSPEELGIDYRRVFDLARPHLQTRDNEAHTLISAAYTLALLETGGEKEVALPAILLHDIGWSKVPEEMHLTSIGPNATTPEAVKTHEAEGAAMAEKILADLAYPPDRIALISNIVLNHDTGGECSCLEEKIVRDADKLFRFSPEGFPLTVGWYGFDPLTHLAWIEARIPSWFLTPLGFELARIEAAARKSEIIESLEKSAS